VLGLFAISILALAGFVLIERRVRAPMVDFAFFRSRTSAGANLVGFLATFGMFAQFFFITLYLQNVLHYSALQTGLRFLPATIVIIIMGPLAGKLTDRVGPRSLMTVGLLIVAGAMLIQSRISVHSGYGLLLPGFILMGLGMGLVMSPMSTAAMNAVDRSKAGAASGVLSMSRMVGGAVGLAAMGALVAAVGKSQLSSLLPHLPPTARAHIVSSLGSGSGSTGAGQASGQVVHAIHSAFISALGTGLGIGAAVMVVGAVIAWVLIERMPAPAPEATEERESAAREHAAEATLVS
jgi:MFS family permease